MQEAASVLPHPDSPSRIGTNAGDQVHIRPLHRRKKLVGRIDRALRRRGPHCQPELAFGVFAKGHDPFLCQPIPRVAEEEPLRPQTIQSSLRARPQISLAVLHDGLHDPMRSRDTHKLVRTKPQQPLIAGPQPQIPDMILVDDIDFDSTTQPLKVSHILPSSIGPVVQEFVPAHRPHPAFARRREVHAGTSVRIKGLETSAIEKSARGLGRIPDVSVGIRLNECISSRTNPVFSRELLQLSILPAIHHLIRRESYPDRTCRILGKRTRPRGNRRGRRWRNDGFEMAVAHAHHAAALDPDPERSSAVHRQGARIAGTEARRRALEECSESQAIETRQASLRRQPEITIRSLRDTRYRILRQAFVGLPCAQHVLAGERGNIGRCPHG